MHIKQALSYIAVFIIGLASSVILNRIQRTPNVEIKASRKIKIALLTRLSSYHEGAVAGFKEAVTTEFPDEECEVKRFILTKRDLQLASSLVDEAVAGNPDLIVSVGALLSQTARSVTQRRKQDIPVIFVGATNPVSLGLVESLEQPQTNMTGINMTDVGEDMPVQVLHFLKPDARHVLLPYSPLSSGGEVEQHVFHAKMVLESKGTRVTLIPVDELSEVLPKVRGLISTADTVMYLPGCLVEEVAEGLIKLCTQHGVSLFANQPLTVKQGAAFGYGTDTRILGAQACKIAKAILIDKQKPENMPVQFMDFGRRTAINLDAARKQNLQIPRELLFLISRGIIYQNGEEA